MSAVTTTDHGHDDHKKTEGGIGAWIMANLKLLIMGLVILGVFGYFLGKKYLGNSSPATKQETVATPEEKDKEKAAEVADDDAPKKKHHKKSADDSDGTVHTGGIHVSQTVDIDGERYSTSIPSEDDDVDEDDE